MARKTKKFCWVWNIKPEYVDEYVKMHLNPWPEIMRAHSECGFKNYSIFRNGCQFIYEFECDGDAEAAFAKVVKDPDCIRWNSITTKMLDVTLKDGAVNNAVQYLPEVFYLE
jgi:L-rhamnose mutarotase